VCWIENKEKDLRVFASDYYNKRLWYLSCPEKEMMGTDGR
jgi:hypothetical protein